MSPSNDAARTWPSSAYRPAPGTIPEFPGVYRFLDAGEKAVYVGKAKNLRARLSTYFQDPARLHPRTQAMLEAARSVRWTVVGSESEALVLEQQWIHAFDPRFNVRMRDGKSYPSLALTTSEEIPRALVWRGARRPGVRFFGPYPHGRDVAGILDALLRAFPVRSCSKGFFERHQREGRPCLLADLGKCTAPCVGRITPADHRSLVNDLSRFLAGDTRNVIQRLEAEMGEAAENLDFERAARRRDDVQALRGVIERQRVVLEPNVDADVFAHAADALQCSWYVFFVRGGVVRGVRSWVVEIDPSVTAAESAIEFLARAYTELAREGGTLGTGVEITPPARSRRRGIRSSLDSVLAGVEENETGPGETGADTPTESAKPNTATLELPPEILIDVQLSDTSALEAALGELSGQGARVRVRTPQRGSKHDLLETVSRNAAQVLASVSLQRATDLTARTSALSELAEAIGMSRPPLRIECYDISHTQGSVAVGSMVVFEDGLPRKDAYRQFNISPEAGGDDLASMREVLSRRFAATRTGRRVAEETGEVILDEQTRRQQLRFASLPDLVIVDGGQPQVAVAHEVMSELGVGVELCGLAKRLEEVWLPEEADPVILGRSSEAMFLIQRLRDEAHRFAITAHRKRRSKVMTASILDTVPGLGPAKRTLLLQTFGSAAAIADASDEELFAISGVGPALVASLRAALSPERPPEPGEATREQDAPSLDGGAPESSAGMEPAPEGAGTPSGGAAEAL